MYFINIIDSHDYIILYMYIKTNKKYKIHKFQNLSQD